MRELIAPAAMAFVLSVGLTIACRRFANYLNAIATPSADRWHATPVPVLGGVAIFTAFLLTSLALLDHNTAMWGLLSGASALFLLGLADDLRPFKPHIKFICQVLVACGLIGIGLQLHLTQSPPLNLLITLIWIVGITNAFNLLDNMDGLAAGIAIVTTGFRLTFFLIDGNAPEAALASILIGALLGFLIFNWNPASIFMGDAGSLFIGCYVAGLNLLGDWPYSRGTLSVMVLPVLILLVPIFDTTFVTITRTLARRPISTGGRDHTSHRLVALGLSEPKAVLFLYGIAIFSGLIALFSYEYGLSYSVTFIALLFVALILLGVYIAGLRTLHPKDTTDAKPRSSAPPVIPLSYIRRTSAVVLDLTLISIAYYSAYLLRFEAELAQHTPKFFESLPLLALCQLLVFWATQVYQGVWRYTSIPDLIRLSQASVLGVTAGVVAIATIFSFTGYSTSVFLIYSALLLLFVTSSRLSFRLLGEFLQRRRAAAIRVVIYGAGDGGVLALRELLNNSTLGREPSGFIDDDPTKQLTKIQGYTVFGSLHQLEDIIRSESIGEVVIASNHISTQKLEALATTCEAHGVSLARATLRFE